MSVWKAKHQALLLEWRKRILDCRRSGMSVAEWCAANHIAASTYYRWEKEALDSQNLHSGEFSQMARAVGVQILDHPDSALSGQPETTSLVASLKVGQDLLNVYKGASPKLVNVLCEVLVNAQ